MPFLKHEDVEDNQLGERIAGSGKSWAPTLCPALPEDCFWETKFPLAKLEWGVYPTCNL